MRERVSLGGESLGLSHDQSLINGAKLFLGRPRVAAKSVGSHLEVAWSFTIESMMIFFFKV